MAKPTNSERIYSDKLPIVLKPVGCSYTDAEWKRYIRLFPANGWGIADEKDTRDNGKISDVVNTQSKSKQKSAFCVAALIMTLIMLHGVCAKAAIIPCGEKAEAKEMRK